MPDEHYSDWLDTRRDMDLVDQRPSNEEIAGLGAPPRRAVPVLAADFATPAAGEPEPAF